MPGTVLQPRRDTARWRPLHRLSLPDGGLRVVFDQPQRVSLPGRAVVLYDGDEVLGGGTIEKSE